MQSNNAFDFRPIFSYTQSSSPDSFDTSHNINNEKDLFSKILEGLIIALSHIAVFFTLPLSVWFCFLTLSQWERVITYRMGKLTGIKGPGTVFVIPWIDTYHKLDLRTKVMQTPSQQFVTQDRAIFEGGCDFHYRIADPLMFTNSYRDPKFRGLQKLSQAVAFRQMVSKDERDLIKFKRTIEDEIMRELNSVTVAWGIEINTVDITNLRQIAESQPRNPLGSLFQQLGSALLPSQTGASQSGEAEKLSQIATFQGFTTSDSLIDQIQHRLDCSPAVVGTDLAVNLKIKKGDENTQLLKIKFTEGRGTVSSQDLESTGDVTVEIKEATLKFLLNGASSSQLLESYFSGDIQVSGDPRVLSTLQQCLGQG